MYRLNVKCGAYVCRTLPEPSGAKALALIDAAVSSSDAAPDLLYWDLEVEDGGAPVGRVRFGAGGLDRLLAIGTDLSGCIAVNISALDALKRKGALGAGEELGKAIRLLARSPSLRTAYCPGLVGSADRARIEAKSSERDGSPATEAFSVALISTSDEQPFSAQLDAIAIQVGTARVEVLVLISGGTPAGLKARARAIDDWSRGERKLTIRRFMLAGEFSPAYLVNTAMALATGEIVVVAHPACLPRSPEALKMLVGWAARGHVATASPRVTQGGRLVSAGLACARLDDGGSSFVERYGFDLMSRVNRLCAAPEPWMFATRRQNWISVEGLRGRNDELWTASMAGRDGPAGRHMLVGAAEAEWMGDVETLERAMLPRPLRAAAASALRSPERLTTEDRLTADIHGQTEDYGPSMVADQPIVEVTAKRVSDKTKGFPGPAWRDMNFSAARHRLLIFADAAGPSQAIAFQQGLRQTRERGEVAICLHTEAGLEGHGPRLRGIMRSLAEAENPTLIVASRLGDPAIWSAVECVARSLRVPLLFHIDDDLLGAPVTLGVERFRAARHPQRLRTLREAVVRSDAVLAATSELAKRLTVATGRLDVMVMPGSAGASPSVRKPLIRAEIRIGYMGSASHNDDLAAIAPAVNSVLEANHDVKMVLFGSIAKQPARRLLRGEVEIEEGVFGDYNGFRRRLAELDLDIGLAPLASNAFNRAKTSVKWLEYAEAGVAVIASDIPPYREIGEAGALLPVGTQGWAWGIAHLAGDVKLRSQLIKNANTLIQRHHTWDLFEAGMVKILESLSARHALRSA